MANLVYPLDKNLDTDYNGNMNIEMRQKLIRLLKELTKEEIDSLYAILQDAHSSHVRAVSSKDPAEATRIQYDGVADYQANNP